jgi:hypothetical protein
MPRLIAGTDLMTALQQSIGAEAKVAAEAKSSGSQRQAGRKTQSQPTRNSIADRRRRAHQQAPAKQVQKPGVEEGEPRVTGR